jgi:hypothetical protein
VRASNFIKPIAHLEDVHVKALAGVVGVTAALQFRKSLATGLRVSPEDVLLNFGKNKGKLKDVPPPELVLLNERLAFWLNGRKPDDREAGTVRKNFLAYLKHLQESKKGEVIAHLASLLEEQRFARAMALLAGSTQVIEALTDYIQGIKVD